MKKQKFFHTPHDFHVHPDTVIYVLFLTFSRLTGDICTICNDLCPPFHLFYLEGHMYEKLPYMSLQAKQMGYIEYFFICMSLLQRLFGPLASFFLYMSQTYQLTGLFSILFPYMSQTYQLAGLLSILFPYMPQTHRLARLFTILFPHMSPQLKI